MEEALSHQLTQGQGWPESGASLHFVPWASAVLPQAPGYDIHTLTHAIFILQAGTQGEEASTKVRIAECCPVLWVKKTKARPDPALRDAERQGREVREQWMSPG